ncbi:GTP cyclohydrolase II [Nocardia arthritidis]|uniref:GTP cyclohydrolase II n=1 Tax=Nocardia arthritidis TaxID=228602 RepID=UPI001EEABC74|nr:GTP cyclohydrolase II [Nocardia arthritidis]
MSSELSFEDTRHIWTRNGRQLPVRVLELPHQQDGGYALVFGEIADDCLVRIHSRCLYGEVLGADDCDCGQELDKSLDLIARAGHGVLIYLEQEGRGLGLIAKARGMALSQRMDIDTFESYELLGYPADNRCYKLAAETLLLLGLRSVRLLTNNPQKADALWEAGLQVTVLALRTEVRSERAQQYLEAKRRHRKHWIPDDRTPWAPDQAMYGDPAPVTPPRSAGRGYRAAR